MENTDNKVAHVYKKSEQKYYRGKVMVIGNAHYDAIKPDLDNSINDAKGIAEKFTQLGYRVMEPLLDMSVYDFDTHFEDFKKDLASYDVGVFYFAGHGIEIEGKNYLLMKDTPIGELAKTTIRYSIELQGCVKELHDTGCKMIILIIDACRDNPFEGKERGWGSVKLAPIFAPKGTLIAYSTSPGERATDYGMEGHSAYTGALLKHLSEEGLEIELFFKKVRSTVNAITKGNKTSWEHTSLIGSFAFNSGKMVQADNLGYSATAISDKDYVSNSKVVNSIIDDFKSYNWYEQNDAVDNFKQVRINTFSKDDLFVIGRNILQAAMGGAFAAQGFLADASLVAKYNSGDENHLLNGILFEMYFDSSGHFRYNSLKNDRLDDVLGFVTNKKLKTSFAFIEKALSPFRHLLMFVPSPHVKNVDINVCANMVIIQYPYGGEGEECCIQSVMYNDIELLASEDDSATFPFNYEWKVTEMELKSILCQGYGIPMSKLRIISNMDFENKKFWFNKKFKKDFL